MDHEDRRSRLIELFALGVELEAPQREALVERTSGDDPQLGGELAELLRVEARGLGDFLARPAVARADDVEADLDGDAHD